MDSGTLLVAGFFGLLLLTALVALRTVSAGRIEVKLTDAAIAAIPILLWLLGSGQVTKLVVGAEGITVETTRMAILEAADRPIENQVAPLPVAPVAIAAKARYSKFPRLSQAASPRSNSSSEWAATRRMSSVNISRRSR